MKLNKFLMGIIGAVAFLSCSSENPVENGSDSPELGQGENFISVAIEMPASAGSRAANTDPFDDGTPNESKVENIVFFFFDDADNCIEVQKVDNPKFENPAKPSQNPNITNFGTVEVRLKAGLDYKKVGVALNSPADNATVLKNQIKSVSDYLARTYDYAKGVKNDGSGQVMSNSIYFDMLKASDLPSNDKKVDVIKITSKNIYSSAERDKIDQMIAKKEKDYVEIYVERVLAKIEVGVPDFNMEEYYIIGEKDEHKKTITVFNHVDGTSREVIVRPEVKGMILNVLAPQTALVKPIIIDEVGYVKAASDYKAFQWNDPDNKRSYWASTAFLGAGAMKYYSWNNANNKNINRDEGGLAEYIHPNTQDFEPIAKNEGSSLNTKIMVVAELQEFKDGSDKGSPIDLVMFGADYMLAEDFRNYVASLVNRDIRNIEWTNDMLGLDGTVLTEDQLNNIKTKVNARFSDATGLKSANFDLEIADTPDDPNQYGEADWLAEVSLKNGVDMPSMSDLADVAAGQGIVTAVNKVIADTRDATLSKVNETNIFYWKGGKTYFYANIRHQGFTGLVGTGESDFLYGVVRNHVYKVTLSGIYGLGTPVIDPDKPINPDHPGDERPSYMKARINILPWRVVTNNATIH
ncbi:MAG: fimbria major subunit [Muribaculaceae bacterium]|nr:fimbria major subunit [Muribaculaceae bacterium]